MPRSAPEALIVESLVVDRGRRAVIEGLSFRVDRGGTLELTGPNGAGKTTLIKAVAGLLAPRGGTIRLAGSHHEREVGEQCHLVGHRDAVKSSLTVIENARFWARYLAGGQETRASRVETAITRLGLGELARTPAGYLSAGQRRRLGLTRLLVADRPLWLLDEPTVSLDAAGREALAQMVAEHCGGGGIVIAATHLPLGLARTRELRLGTRAQAA
jgi:heme exporter protein A